MNKKIKKNKQINRKSKHTIRNNKLIIKINKQNTQMIKLIIANDKLKMKMRNYKGLILFIKTQNEIKNKNNQL